MGDRKAQGIEATNQEFRRYDQVEKRQEYHLAEAHHGEAFDEETRIRTCDLGRFLHGNEADKQAFAGELGDALRRLGFAILDGHGVDPTLYDEADERILELFTGVPLEEKLRYRARALRLGQPGLLPDQGDHRHPPRPGRGLGVLPARVRPRRRPDLPRGRLLAAARASSRSSAGCARPTSG